MEIRVLSKRGGANIVVDPELAKALDVRGHKQLRDLIRELLENKAKSEIDSDTISDWIASQRTTLWLNWDVTDKDELALATTWFVAAIESLTEFANG